MNTIWILTLSFLTILYCSFALFLRFGLNRKYDFNPQNELTVSVIVSARNEAAHIKQCLLSLDRLNYPEPLLEIFIVNDRSEDATYQIVSQFIKNKPKFKVISNDRVNINLSGKAHAISQAIEKCRGEIIFITDADCVVSPGWIRNMTAHFSDGVGMVAGFTLLDISEGLFSRLQALDWNYLLTVAAGTIGLGIPLSCIGNNFAVRRTAYEQVGGYEKVGFSVAEDFALLKALATKTDWKIVFPLGREALVRSQPVHTMKEFFAQRKRWAIGGISVQWFGKVLIVVSVVAQLMAFFSLFFKEMMLPGLIAWALILGCDFFLLYSPLKRLGVKGLLKYLPIYKMFSLFYMVKLALILPLNRTVVWKGVTYNQNKIYF